VTRRQGDRQRGLRAWIARLGSVPADETAARTLLQRRLALLATVLLVGWAAAVTLGLGLTALFDPRVFRLQLRFPPTWMLVGGTLVLAVVTARLRGRPMARASLLFADAAVSVLQGLAAAVMLAFTPGVFRPEFAYLFGVCHVLFLRAALIPSTPGRTAWIGALALGPLVPATYLVYQARQAAPFLPAPLPITLGIALWAAFAVATMALLGAVIYGLARRARAALVLGQYTLEEKIGEGAMGVVYRARHALLRRPTAVKLLPAAQAGEGAIARFAREVQLTAELSHPNIISVYDFGHTDEGVFYYAMEYLEGIDLESIVQADGPQPPGRVCSLLRQLGEALAEAHTVGLIHRDVKPANVIVCPRRRGGEVAKLLDFGLVKQFDGGDPQLSEVKVPVGTPAYMSPEAITRPDTVDERSDLYCLGGVGYALLAGRPPFAGETAMELLAHQLHTPPVPPSVHRGSPLPAALEALVLECLSKDAEQRPPDAEAFLSALEASAVPPWEETEADRWWRERAPALAARRTRTAPAGSTLAVDLAGRAREATDAR
jgi:eukaryotic-like serine/threonine-protein kinase